MRRSIVLSLPPSVRVPWPKVIKKFYSCNGHLVYAFVSNKDYFVLLISHNYKLLKTLAPCLHANITLILTFLTNTLAGYNM
jgi:hypothetical protein